MTPEKIKEEVLKKIEEEYGIMAADSITAEAIDLALRKQAEAIFEEIERLNLTPEDLIEISNKDWEELKRKWCKK